MRVFIDSFNLIRIESDVYIYQIELEDNLLNWFKNEGSNQFFMSTKPILLHKNDKIMINHVKFPLEIGLVTLTKEFEQKYRFEGQLGCEYHPKHSTFTLFTPVAKEVYVVIDDVNYQMIYQEPVWRADVNGDFEGKTYHYLVRLVDTFKIIKDPYTTAGSILGSHIIDWNQTVPIQKTPVFLKNYVDAVIYEGHIRDMTIHLDVESKGLFEGLSEHSKKLDGSILEYIKKLGITHLQLLPVFDFEDVDDQDKDLKYNWGYNPSQYFSVEGWFSKDPSDPYDRINSFKQLINHAHRLSLGVNMDVVYNHVFQHKTFPYDDLVPGYFYRHDHLNHRTDASYCGNDIETRNYMVRKLIVDSLKHWAIHFQIDGFRFDLMGLLDIETMHLIEQELKAIHPSIMLYGEGWNMISAVPARQRPNLGNEAMFPGYAQFNDFFRNTMKGELHGPELGFTMGNKHLMYKAMDAIAGSPTMFTTPNQSINYVECHDNLTFYDKMLLSCGFEHPEFKICQDFANHLIAISQGIPFYHAGQEFYRSKKGVENSYNSPDVINQIHWNVHEESVNKLKKLLKLRKKYSLYRQTSYNDSVTISRENNIIVYKLENKKDILIHYIKNYFDLEKLPLMHGELIFPSQKALSEDSFIYVDHPGIYIVHIKK